VAGTRAKASADPAPGPGTYILKTDAGIVAGKGPRTASIGVVLKDRDYRDVDVLSKRIRRARTHHVAEYKALIAGLEMARRHGIGLLRAYTDSSLVVNSVNGDSDVQQEDYKKLSAKARLLFKEFEDIRLCWVPREMNNEAHDLADKALGR
jgi:probable phosphoglycerate mutase